MALTREQRFIIKRDLVDEIYADTERWGYRDINLLLGEFDCEPLSWQDEEYRFEDAIVNLKDADLLSMYTLVLEKPPTGITPQAAAELELDITPIWKPGMVRLFLSHSARHKKFASEVAEALEPLGISGFVAHESMTFDHGWQDQILVGLRTMQAFVVLLHSEVNESAWCQQEIGWAQGSDTPHYLVRLGVDPAGFIGRIQYPQVNPEDAKQVAALILQWLTGKDEFAEPLIAGLLSALETSTGFIDSIRITDQLAQVKSLTDEQWQRLDNAVLDNDQVGNSGGARNNLRPFYQVHKRQWPPVKSQITKGSSWSTDPNEPF